MADQPLDRKGTRELRERELLGAMMVVAERAPIPKWLPTMVSPSHFTVPTLAALFRQLTSANRPIFKTEMIDTLVIEHALPYLSAERLVDGLRADAPRQPHLRERAKRVSEQAATGD